MKLIDADKLIAEIERRILQEQGFEDGDAECGYKCALKDIKRFITSLQQEQSKAIEGVVHYALGTSWIVTNHEQLHARLKQFPEGAEVELFIEAKKRRKANESTIHNLDV